MFPDKKLIIIYYNACYFIGSSENSEKSVRPKKRFMKSRSSKQVILEQPCAISSRRITKSKWSQDILHLMVERGVWVKEGRRPTGGAKTKAEKQNSGGRWQQKRFLKKTVREQ